MIDPNEDDGDEDELAVVCPRCGCTDAEILRRPKDPPSWFKPGRAKCQNCGLEFTVCFDGQKF